MNLESRIAYIQAQTVCALAEIESMKAANKMREDSGNALAYGEEAFLQIPYKYGIHHNAVIGYLQQ